ncbi:MAG: tetratricopeptide repeat protein [Gammaproteobacteria bacterium]
MKAFFDELRRRGVAKAAAVYAVVAWAVIESSSVIFPALQLPDWTVTFIILIALFGFPVTLIFAWVFDWTRQGIVRTPTRAELSPAEAQTLHRGRVLDFAVIAVLLVIIGWLGWERAFDREDAAALDSIAVLPFVNMSGDPDNEYFGDGLAEELLNSLVRVNGLRVAARTSSFEYKGQNIDVRRIGEALNVATVLEGSVRRAGDRVRVTAQLIRTDDGFHLWSDTFDASLEDIFAVQDRIALAIVDALRVTLGTRGRALVTAHNTHDVEAFEAYLRGRFEMNRRTAPSLERAVAEFRSAISRDPGYAAAYSGLSDSLMLRSSYGGVPTDEAVRQAEPMARRALELNPGLAEAHASMALVLQSKEQFTESVAPLLRAIELNPSYSPAYHWLGLSYKQLGRYNEAVEVLQKAVEVDPQYLTGKRALMGALRDVGRHAEADAYGERIAREHADDPMALYGLAGDARARGDRVQALLFFARGLRIAPDNVSLRVPVAYLLLEIGDYERADEQVEIVRRINPNHQVHEGWVADRAAQTGDTETMERELVARYAAMPAGLLREQFGCNALLLAGRRDEAARACHRVFQYAGWEPGEPLPPEQVNTAANLLMAESESGESVLRDQLLSALAEVFERMRATGLDAEEVDWARAIITAHSEGDIEPLLRLLPTRFARGSWNWRQVRENPMFAPVRDDPRFIALVDGLRDRAERDRIAAQQIEIPGL